MLNTFKYNRDIMRIPVTFFIKDTTHEVSRGVMACLSLEEALKSVFPHLHKPDSKEILPEFAHVKVKIMGADLELSTPLFYAYECFKSITGTLYLTLVF